MAQPAAPSDAAALIHDWNEIARRGPVIPPGFTFFDETLRDGLQNPSVRDPAIEPKLKLLHLMHDLGIHAADIGLPGSSKRAFDDVLRMCREIADHKLRVQPACAGRTVASDILPMVEISQKSGIPVEVYAFIGSSAIRQLVEDWSEDLLAKRAAEAIDVGVKNGLPVAFVTEDTSRSHPKMLATLFKVAIDHGGPRGSASATPRGMRPPTASTTSSPSPARSSPAWAPRTRCRSTGTATTTGASPW
jgi:2-isopropylmalate synthase